MTSQGVGLQSFGIVTVNNDGTDVLPSTIYGGSNTNGVTYSGIDYDSNTSPKFMSNFEQRVATDGSDDRAFIRMEMVNNSTTTAGEEMIDEGVIFVCSAGNGNQKLVKGDHSDYNNYWNTGTDVNKSINETIFTYGSFEYYKTINRAGFPQQIGKKWDGVAGVTTYRTITIGNLDANYYASGSSVWEIKRNSSNMGNFVRCYAPGNGVVSANAFGPAAGSNVGVNTYARYDDSYTIGSDTAVDSKDRIFGGTSAACPVAAGLIATKLQYQRNWTYDNVMNWIDSMPELDSDLMYTSWESTIVDSNNWSCNICLQGGPARVIWDQQTMAEYGPLPPDTKLRIVGVGLTITTNGVGGLSFKSG